MEDKVNHPKHYTSHPSGVECIQITRHYCFDIGNAIKYLWRAGLKSEEGMEDIDKEIEDLQKSQWYINDRIEQLKQKRIITYRLAFRLILKGIWSIIKMLPKTFAKNTAAMVIHHPIYLLFFVSIIVYQFVTIADQRVQRDAASQTMHKLQTTIDSLQFKHFSYQHYTE